MIKRMSLKRKVLQTCVQFLYFGLVCVECVSLAVADPVKPASPVKPKEVSPSGGFSLKKILQKTGAEIIKKKDLGDISQIIVKLPDGRKEVGYTTKDNRYLIVGNVIDTKTGENLTALAYQKLSKVDVSKIPLNEAIKLKFGTARISQSGAKKLIMIADPDCPFCREAYQFLKKQNVEIYLFLFPLEQIHPHSYNNAVKILCSKDPAKAYEDLEDGKPLKTPLCKEGEEKLKKYILLGNKLQVDGTPTFFTMQGYKIVGANIPELEEVLK